MGALFDKNAAIVLAKAARHCCVCRQFLPLYIQVHHIKERCNGGTDGIHNLIPVCIQCHSAIHTKTNMTRAFSEMELKISRDSVYQMVEEGKLTANDKLNMNNIEHMLLIFNDQLIAKGDNDKLSEKATELLVKTYYHNSNVQVQVNIELCYVKIGTEMLFFNVEKYQKYPKEIIELLEKRLLVEENDTMRISESGEILIQGLIGEIPTYTQVKVKCLNCGLHFIVCTEYKDRRLEEDIYCPECGVHGGPNIIWVQEKPGFIFEDVPGSAMTYKVNIGNGK